METLIVILIVAAAVIFSLRSFVKIFKDDGGCSCGGCSCSSKENGSADFPVDISK